MTGLRISILGTVASIAVSTLGVTSCSSGPCSLRHVVTASNSGMKVDQIELDDGFVYVPLQAESLYAHEYTTGTEVRVCQVASQVDGTMHYSIIATDVQGSPTEMRRLAYQGIDN